MTALAVLAGPVCAGGECRAGAAAEPLVHRPGWFIEFTRKCADAEAHKVQAYALLDSGDGRARALVAAMAGYLQPDATGVVVGAELQALALRAGPDWRDASFSLRLGARSAAARAEGEEVAVYHARERGAAHPAPRQFRTDAGGRANWLTFAEPGEEDSASAGSHRFAQVLNVPAVRLGVHGPRPGVELALVVRNLASGERLRLAGPSLSVPARVWRMRAPEPRVMGLAATLNPLDEDGLWGVLRRGWKYRGCLAERAAAKRMFREWR